MQKIENFTVHAEIRDRKKNSENNYATSWGALDSNESFKMTLLRSKSGGLVFLLRVFSTCISKLSFFYKIELLVKFKSWFIASILAGSIGIMWDKN